MSSKQIINNSNIDILLKIDELNDKNIFVFYFYFAEDVAAALICCFYFIIVEL
jgi:hypothetical protein